MARRCRGIERAMSPVWEDASVPCGGRGPFADNVDVFNWDPSRPPAATPLACFVSVSFSRPYRMFLCYLVYYPSPPFHSLLAVCLVEVVVPGALCKRPPMLPPFANMLMG